MPGEPETVAVSAGIYAYIQPDGSWYINNTGFIIGAGGVISIDTCSTQRRTRAYLDAVAAVTGSRACPRWTPRGRPISASTRAGLIPNGSWETCIAATRSSTGPSGDSPST
jgi:hypothetical protein